MSPLRRPLPPLGAACVGLLWLVRGMSAQGVGLLSFVAMVLAGASKRAFNHHLVIELVIETLLGDGD